jgi:hypothetical protein
MAVVTPTGLPAAFLEPFAEKVTDILAGQLAPIEEGYDISGITPTVAAVSPLIQQAQQRAATQAGLGTLQFSPETGQITNVGTGTGVASYEPYLQRAEALAAPSAYQQYMSPYQQEVLDATQALLGEQRAAGRTQLGAQQVAQGAFGQGRGQVAEAEYERQKDIYDAGILANLRQQGLEQAQRLQQQGIATQVGLGQTQQQLGQAATTTLGQAGTGAQTYSQSVLDALRAGNILAEEYPMTQLGRAVNIFSPLLSGAQSYQTPGTPIGTSPGLAAAQAFGSSFGPILQSMGKTNLMPQQQQQQPQQFGLASIYGGV